jgi:hypothetical protein
VSVCKKQLTTPALIPKNLIKIQTKRLLKLKIIKIRKKAEVPNFNRSAANKILALVGAST